VLSVIRAKFSDIYGAVRSQSNFEPINLRSDYQVSFTVSCPLASHDTSCASIVLNQYPKTIASLIHVLPGKIAGEIRQVSSNHSRFFMDDESIWIAWAVRACVHVSFECTMTPLIIQVIDSTKQALIIEEAESMMPNTLSDFCFVSIQHQE
jgi:hypothetical protein